MVRKERADYIKRDRSQHKCDGCGQVWVSDRALKTHQTTCAPMQEQLVRAQSHLKNRRATSASPGPFRWQGMGGYIREIDRITPSNKELKIAMQRYINATDGIDVKDQVMPQDGRMYVTPGMAQFWLQFNGNNVEPSYDRVEEYAQEMAAGRWYDSRQPICFRDNGDLCSGQHRLLAHVYTETGFEYRIELGVTKEQESVIDIGRKRTIANFLSRGGAIKYHRQVAQAASALWSHDSFPIPFNGARKYRARPQPNQTVIVPYVSSHPEIEEAAVIMQEQYRPATRLLTKGASIGAAAALYVLMQRNPENDELTHKFWSLLASGEMLTVGSPIYALREQLITSISNTKSSMDGLEKMAKTIKAFNDFAAGRARKSIVWRIDEPFPLVG